MKIIYVLLILMLFPVDGMTQQEFSTFKTWMAEDPTDQNKYVNVTYDCLAFSSAFAENATRAGYKDVCMANIQAAKYPEGHWINAVLVDGFYVFIEPQVDIVENLEGASITIVDNSMEGMKELKGKNKITVTGNMLIPIKT